MTKLRFYINLVLMLLLCIATAMVSGNSILVFVDIASLILAIILPYIIVCFIFTPREQIKFKKEIFKPDGAGDKKELEKALVYFKSFKNLLISSGILWTIMGTIGILTHLQNPDHIGPNFAVALIVPLYIALFFLIVVEPLRASAEKNLKG